MGKDKPQSLAQKFLENCRDSKTPWCPLPTHLKQEFLTNKRLAPYGRIFEALWLMTVAKPRSFGEGEIKISVRELAEASSTCPSDASRFLRTAAYCELIRYYREEAGRVGRKNGAGGQEKSTVAIFDSMLNPKVLSAFFEAFDDVLTELENHTGRRPLFKTVAGFAERVLELIKFHRRNRELSEKSREESRIEREAEWDDRKKELGMDDEELYHHDYVAPTLWGNGA